jgi:hypothetical protein
LFEIEDFLRKAELDESLITAIPQRNIIFGIDIWFESGWSLWLPPACNLPPAHVAPFRP